MIVICSRDKCGQCDQVFRDPKLQEEIILGIHNKNELARKYRIISIRVPPLYILNKSTQNWQIFRLKIDKSQKYTNYHRYM